MDLKILTFNVRYLNQKDGINHWNNRKALIIQVIQKYNPDIIGFQETVYSQLNYLTENLPDYSYYGVGRNDGKKGGEFSPIFYRKEFNAIDQGTFWLSSKPNKPHRTWGRAMKRIVSWIQFGGDEPFLILNTHFPLKAAARLKSIELIKKRLFKQLQQLPIILTGDFNFSPHDKEYQKMKEILHDSYLMDPSNDPTQLITSFHGFTGAKTMEQSPSHEGRIDYFWINDLIQADHIHIVYDNPSSNPLIYPTDHWPLYGEFVIKVNSQ